MKKLIILLLPIFLFSSLIAQHSKELKACYVYSHKYEFGIPSKEGQLLEIRTYSNNKIRKVQYVNQFRRKRNYVIIDYNKAGLKVKKTRLSRRDQIIRITTYKYNSHEKLLIEKIFNGRGKLSAKTVREYSKNGLYEKVRIEYDMHGIRKKIVTEKISADGQRISGSIYGRSMEKALQFEVQERDSLGNEIKQVFTKPDGSYFLTISKKFNSQNQKIFEYYEGKHKKKYEYNEFGLAKETYYELYTGEPVKLIRYVYTLK